MFFPGTNGFLTVLGSLLGLRDVSSEAVWDLWVRDVRWVIGEVLKAKQARGYVVPPVSVVL